MQIKLFPKNDYPITWHELAENILFVREEKSSLVNAYITAYEVLYGDIYT